SIGLDASFSLGGLEVAPYNLGVGIDFKTGKPSLQLDGLGLSMDMNGLTLGGMFAKYQPDPKKEPDFLGALQVGVFDLFSLSAIGGYSTIQGNPSLFIFANLDAPLGGPPYFFVTGIAGGFGVNRRLPPVFPLQDNPFLKVMRGEIAFDPKKGMRESLELLGKQFTPEMNAFWIAAGLEFTSFAFINGKVGAAISVPFKFQLFGSAGFGIEDLAYIEIEFGTEVTPEYVLTQAGLSHNSYLIHPDIFGLQGQFALGVWYAGEHAGEFVLSIGGYHPLYTPPSFYPSVERIEVRATLWGYVNLSVSCFFTLTAHEIMAGAAVSLWGEFAGISAGLDVYVDVLIRWDPFYLVARMGVCVWFVFMGRHEIGVDLKIYTPEFGGEATIDLFLVSFTISFGADEARPPPLPVKDFAKNHLRLAPSGGEHSVTVPSFTKGDTQGLFRLDVGWGRTVEKAESKEDESQEGLEDSTAIPVNVEFGLVVKSRMPLMNAAADSQSPGRYKGKLHLPLCEIADLDGHVGVFAEKGATAIGPSSRRRVTRAFPTSAYGSQELEETQASAANRADLVQAAAAAAKTINGMGGVTLEYKAEPKPPQSPVVKGTEELEHDTADFYPLPLQSRVVSPGIVLKRSPLVIRTLSGRTALGGGASLLRALRPVAPASAAAPPPPPKLAVREAALPRVRRLRVAGAARPDPGKAIPNMPAGVTPIPVPASPARRPELASVRLRMVSAQRTPPRRSAMQQGTNRLVASPRRALAAPLAARQQGSA
ncbi:MAG TPA: DUF6603 domain-containing protein, partial [Myxococcales bacterium]|nr:DUF6603 domain-containing protein [Myxococcales bacterium]